MQLISLIISYRRICSKMLFRILGTWLFAHVHKIISLNRIQILRWHFRSLMLMHANLINWALVNEVVQVQLLLISGLSLSISVILETVLAKLWEVLEVIWFISICDCLRWLFLVFNSVKALSINVFFLFRTGVHMIYRWEFHLGVLSVFVSGFGASLSFVITPVNGS